MLQRSADLPQPVVAAPARCRPGGRPARAAAARRRRWAGPRSRASSSAFITSPSTSCCVWSTAAVADPHRPRVGVPGQVVEGHLGQPPGAVDGVHDLEIRQGRRRWCAAASPARGRPRRCSPACDQRAEGEGGVAQPAVAVVPVALAAEVLGQRGGRRGDDAAGDLVGHQPEGEQASAARRRGAARPSGRSSSTQLVVVVDWSRSGRGAVEPRGCAYDGNQVIEKVSSSPSRDVELVVVPVVVGTGSRGPRSTSWSGPPMAVITGSPSIVTAAHPGLDGAVVEPHPPLVVHPDRAADPGEPADQVDPSVAARHHVGEGDHARVGGERGLERRPRRRRSGGSTGSRRRARTASGRGRRCRAAPARQAGESKRGRHSQSTEPLVPTSAAVRRSPIIA